MDLNLQDNQQLWTFDFGIKNGNLVADSDLVWCVDSKEDALIVRNIQNRNDASLPYHNFETGSNEKFHIVTANGFEYNQQRYMLISLETKNDQHLLVVFKISVSRVICAFRVPHKVSKIELVVKNRHYIDNNKNQNILRHFDVCAVCACVGGAIQLFDVTPTSDLYKWSSNEYSPLEVHWFDAINPNDSDEFRHQKERAHHVRKILGLTLNRLSLSKNWFKYSTPNENLTITLPTELVKITSLIYEKQIDSLLVGFNFGCFQIWNMKSMSVESCSDYGENNKPIVGFSLMQPENDPKKCLYLMVVHSSPVDPDERNLQRRLYKHSKQEKQEADFSSSLLSENDESVYADDRSRALNESELDSTLERDENDFSFTLVYQLMFDKCTNVFLSQNEFYLLYESINYCAIVFEHEFTNDTLKCVKTNYSTNEQLQGGDQDEVEPSIESKHSRIISIQTLKILNNRLQIDLACLTWALIDKHSSSQANYYLSIFNLNNWYAQCMPSKMRPLSDLCPEGKSRLRKNIYFNNYTLSINNDLEAVKFVQIIDSKIKKHKNQNLLSSSNCLRRLIDDRSEHDESDHNMGYDSNLDDDTYLSMHFDLVVLTPFSLLKISIKPIEHQIHHFVSKQDDIIHSPDRVYYLLSKYHLLDKYLPESGTSQPKFIPIFNYLLETSQIYAILKSLWKLNLQHDTSIISNLSLRSVLDWSWNKVVKIKSELNCLNRLISQQSNGSYFPSSNRALDRDDLAEFLQRENNLLDNLIQIYKQFIKLDTTSDGYAQLNKKLCLIESLKCYVEHLILFNKFDLLLAPKIQLPPADETAASSGSADNDAELPKPNTIKNYTKEMEINFKIIQNRWLKRRQEAAEQLGQVSSTNGADILYPFTYMIDCIVEECKSYANVSKLFNRVKSKVKFSDECDPNAYDEAGSNIYPPKSINDLLEICLECNLSTKIKQIIILYVLCDLMHTEVTPTIQKHILKLINAYCATTFTLMSTNLDSTLSVPWSSSSTSIVSLSSDSHDPENSSCLFDLVNGLYLIDSRFPDRAFKYLRATDLNYLEFYEKYFILYDSVHVGDFKTASQYLWLFQKLNAASVAAAATAAAAATSPNDLTKSPRSSKNIRASAIENDLGLFNFLTKSNCSAGDLDNQKKIKHEQKMHSRLFVTIYLANGLFNEAYELVKPHVKNVKSSATKKAASTAGVKFSKELMVHFFMQVERFKLLKNAVKLTSMDKDLLDMLLNYLEAKSSDLNLLCMAIDLYVNNRRYKRAIELYDKHSKQISTSEHNYLTPLIEIARELHNEQNSLDMSINQPEAKSNSLVLITPADIKEVASFQYKFTVQLSELCKNSKRCLHLLKPGEDLDYINMLKFQDGEVNYDGRPSPLSNLSNSAKLSTATPKSILSSVTKKRKQVTPYPVHGANIYQDYPSDGEDEESSSPTKRITKDMITTEMDFLTAKAKFQSATEFKSRTLTSSLRISKPISNSVSKSVKFMLTKFTRSISNEDDEEPDVDKQVNTEAVVQFTHEVQLNQEGDGHVERKLVFQDDENDENVNTKKTIDSEAIRNSLFEIVANSPRSTRKSPTKRTPEKPTQNEHETPSKPLMKTSTENELETMAPNNDISMECSGEGKDLSSTDLSPIVVAPKKPTPDPDLMMIEENPNTVDSNTELLDCLNAPKTIRFSELDQLDDHRAPPAAEDTAPILTTVQNVTDEPNRSETLHESNLTEDLTVFSRASDVNERTPRQKSPSPKKSISPGVEPQMIIEQTPVDIQKPNREEIQLQLSPTKQQPTINRSPSKSADTNTNETNMAKFSVSALNNSPRKTPTKPREELLTASPVRKTSPRMSPTIELEKEAPIESDADSDKTIGSKQNSDDELNMSSISASNSPSKINLRSKMAALADAAAAVATEKLLLPDEETDAMLPKLSRSNSQSSLFSQISSVSEHYEKTRQKEAKDDDEKAVSSSQPQRTLRRREPVAKKSTARMTMPRHVDDNDLNNEPEAKKNAKGSLFRRRSDLSSSSSSTISNASSNVQEAVARLREKIPSTFGSNDQEVRVTRSKLKALLEPTVDVPATTAPAAKLTRRNSKRQQQQHLEQVNENEVLNVPEPTVVEPSKMSISNLKKHNAAMEKLEKLNEHDDDEEETESMKNQPRPGRRVTRSKAARSPSPSASSIVSVSTVQSIESVSTVTSSIAAGVGRRRGRAPKTASASKGVEDEIIFDKTLKSEYRDENDSPTGSQVSVASSITARATRRTRKQKELEEVAAAAASAAGSPPNTRKGKNYKLRSKDKAEEKSNDDNVSCTSEEETNSHVETIAPVNTRPKRTTRK